MPDFLKVFEGVRGSLGEATTNITALLKKGDTSSGEATAAATTVAAAAAAAAAASDAAQKKKHSEEEEAKLYRELMESLKGANPTSGSR